MAACKVRSLVALSKCKSLFLQSPSVRRFYSSGVPTDIERVGFIGLGNMGSPMACNLIKAGYNVVVHDVNHTTMKMFSHKGILTKESPFEVAEISDVVITMLPSSNDVLDVYTGPNGLLHGQNLLRPWLLIDSSTTDPKTSRKVSGVVSSLMFKDKKGANQW